MESEIWKCIPGFNNEYEVSNLGQVRSKKFNKSKILSLYKSDKGYYRIKLSINNVRNWYFVHRLVCCAFLDPELLSSELVVNHKNGIRDDNNLENLEIISQLENTIEGTLRKCLEEEYGMDSVKYISKEVWEVYYKNIFLGTVKNIEQAKVAINTAKLLFEIFNK